MNLWAIIPVKPLRRGKSRLAGVLSEDQRTYANEFMLKHVLHEISSIEKLQGILVISSDPYALSVAHEYAVRTIRENRLTNINQALRKATRAAKTLGANAVLILPADLPVLIKGDAQKIINSMNQPPEIIIAPDRYKQGTNAILVNPVNAIMYDFGINSFQKHIEQAERNNVKTNVIISDSIGFDLDLPQDLEFLRQIDENVYAAIMNYSKE